MEFIRFFQSGGPFMYAILAIMALGLAITVDRFLYLNRTQKKAHRVWEKVSPMLRAEDYSRAAHALTEMTGPLAKILSYGFSRLQTNARRESIESAMEEGVWKWFPKWSSVPITWPPWLTWRPCWACWGPLSGLFKPLPRLPPRTLPKKLNCSRPVFQ